MTHKTTLICFGADAGHRVETLIRALDHFHHHGMRVLTCSDVFADTDAGTAAVQVNLLAMVRTEKYLTADLLRPIEDAFGRVRDDDRQMPVALDLDMLGTVEPDSVRWNEKYDAGRPYYFHGLWQIAQHTRGPLLDALSAIAAERDFAPSESGSRFHPLVSGRFVQHTLGA